MREDLRPPFDFLTMRRWQALLGDFSHALALERLGHRLTQRILWRIETTERAVALSFDDGPHPRCTPAMLEVLERYRVPATFFLIGRNVEKHPALARRIAQNGHEIGNHTFSHRILPLLGDEEARREIRVAGEIISATTGFMPAFLRPPMGLFIKRTMDLIEECGHTAVVGDVYPRDPHHPGCHKIYQRVISRVRPGSIIILHDGGNTRHVDRSQTVEATEKIILQLHNEGYRFLTISNLTRLKPFQQLGSLTS